jgi:7-cyano-7-deazaguanine synthase
MKAVVSISGGLDSTTLIHFVVKELRNEIYPVSFYYGQKHRIELEMAKYQINELKKIGESIGVEVHDHKIIDVSFMKDLLGKSTALVSNDVKVPTLEEIKGSEDQPVTYVPFRNTVLLSICLSYAEAVGCNVVYYGAQLRDIYGYWDCTPEYVEAINNITKLNRRNKIKVVAPFINFKKCEIVVLGTGLGVDYSKTWSSYAVVDEKNLIADSSNPTSQERILAFAQAGLVDPIKYNTEINWPELIKTYNLNITYKEVFDKVMFELRDLIDNQLTFPIFRF